jgi:hypothetical protein
LVRKAKAVMRDLEGKGWRPLIASGLRTPKEQQAKVDASKSRTLKSKHLAQADGYGHALDIVDCRYTWVNFKSLDQLLLYRKHLGSSAKAHGLRWGGLWRSYGKYGDWAHVELP